MPNFAAAEDKPAAAPPTQAAPAEPRNPDKLYVDADEIVYDKDKQVVTASGNVVLYYKGRTLQADRVVYDRLNKRMQGRGPRQVHGRARQHHLRAEVRSDRRLRQRLRRTACRR